MTVTDQLLEDIERLELCTQLQPPTGALLARMEAFS